MHWLCPKCRAGFPDRQETCPADGSRLIENMAGRVLAARWGIERLLGVGGGGATVWAAVGLSTRNPVALKLADVNDRIEVLRFERGARISGMLDHPNIARVIEHGRIDGKNMLVMEQLEGETLQRRLARQRALSPSEASHVVDQILDALDHAHNLGVVHRDIKLSNIFVAPTPMNQLFIKILDWGIAKFVGGDPDAPNDGEEKLTITQAQQILGTPEYMAPEQIIGAGSDARTDLYAVGIILYKLLVGRHPFAAKTRADMYQAHLTETPPALPEGFAPVLDALIQRALEKKPEQRWPSAASMRRALRAVIHNTESSVVSRHSALIHASQLVPPPPLAPIPSPSEGTATEHTAPQPQPTRSRRGLWIGLAAAAVVAAAIAIPLALSGGEPAAGESVAGEPEVPAAPPVAADRPEPTRVSEATEPPRPMVPAAPVSDTATANEAEENTPPKQPETAEGAAAQAALQPSEPEPEPTVAETAPPVVQPKPTPARRPAARKPTPPPRVNAAAPAVAAPENRPATEPVAATRDQVPPPEPATTPTPSTDAPTKPEPTPEIEEPAVAAAAAPPATPKKDDVPVAPEVDLNKVIPFGKFMNRPVRVAGADPQYTREARLAKVEGTMIVRCVIERDGSLSGCKVIKPLAHMTQTVMEALSTHRYTPIKFKGEVRRVAYVFNFKFAMQ